MCEHLEELERELKAKGIKETYRGEAWSSNCREWIYYDCFLDIEKLTTRFKFPPFVTTHRNDDERSGLEMGLYCTKCKDAIIGHHPKFSKGKTVVA